MPTLDGTDITLEVKGDDLASLLPEDDNFAKLNKPFRVAARLRMANETLTLSGATVELPGLDATAAFDIGMQPMMGRGRFSLEANSPDLVPLTPAEYAVLQTEKVPLRLKTSGQWDENRWTLDELDFRLARGSVVGSGAIGGPPNFNGTDLTVDQMLIGAVGVTDLGRVTSLALVELAIAGAAFGLVPAAVSFTAGVLAFESKDPCRMDTMLAAVELDLPRTRYDEGMERIAFFDAYTYLVFRLIHTGYVFKSIFMRFGRPAPW